MMQQNRMWRRVMLVALVVTSVSSVLPLALGPAPGLGVRVIARGDAGRADAVAEAVLEAGGEVIGQLPILDGVVARVPATRVAALRGSPGVVDVTEDGTVEFLDDDDG